MSSAGKELCKRGRELTEQQQKGEDKRTKKIVSEMYQKALDEIARLIDDESPITYIELNPYNEYVSRMLVSDGFKRIDTDDGILFSWR